jgi:hypothetical protein
MFLKGIYDQGSIDFSIGEMVNTFGSSPSFDPLFREFVSSFGHAFYELYSGSQIIEGTEYYVMQSGLDLSDFGGPNPSAVGDTFIATESGVVP